MSPILEGSGLGRALLNAGAPVTAVNEIQTLTLSAAPAEGSFRVAFEGQRTALLDCNVSAADMQAALRALATIGANGVSVALVGQVYTVTFDGGNMAGLALPLLTIEDNTLKDAGAADVAIVVAESQAGVTATHRGAPTGSILIDTTNGAFYQNTGTALVPIWSPGVPAGVTAAAAELNLIDNSVAGTAVANKAAVLGADKELDEVHAETLFLGAGAGTEVTASAAEVNTLAGVIAGTAAASKAVVLDANKRVAGIHVQQAVATKDADGAIAIAPGTVKITKVAAANLTLADPAAGDEGLEMTIIALTAAAHVVDNSAGSGFNAGGAGSDVATFGGAVGDSLTIVALGTKWYLKSSTNVVLS